MYEKQGITIMYWPAVAAAIATRYAQEEFNLDPPVKCCSPVDTIGWRIEDRCLTLVFDEKSPMDDEIKFPASMFCLIQGGGALSAPVINDEHVRRLFNILLTGQDFSTRELCGYDLINLKKDT